MNADSTHEDRRKATWDEQVGIPTPTGPEPTLHAHTGAPWGTLRDTPTDGRVTYYRVTA